MQEKNIYIGKSKKRLDLSKRRIEENIIINGDRLAENIKELKQVNEGYKHLTLKELNI